MGINDDLKSIKELEEVINAIKHNMIKHGENMPFGKAECEILFYVYSRNNVDNCDEITITEIAKFFHVTLGAIMHKVVNLEELGYMKREVSTKDRRIKYLTILPKGICILKSMEKHYVEELRKIYQYIGEKDSEELIRILKKIAVFMEEKNDKNN